MLNKEEIKNIIPQREPFLMVDEVESFVPGESCVAYKYVNENEWYFKGHFPENPIMPGVLIVESLAQTGAVAILSLEENKGKNALFGGIDKMKFKKQVVPGDKLKLEVKIIKRKGPIGKKFLPPIMAGDVKSFPVFGSKFLKYLGSQFNGRTYDVKHRHRVVSSSNC